MLDIERNKKDFTHMYEYYKERINTVDYPEYELNKITYQERKKYKDTETPKGPDIMRILHLIIGVFVGIIIGYLLWGAKN